MKTALARISAVPTVVLTWLDHVIFGPMSDAKKILGVALLLMTAALPRGLAQTFPRPAPTDADWLAISKLPDFAGVWEIPLGLARA